MELRSLDTLDRQQWGSIRRVVLCCALLLTAGTWSYCTGVSAMVMTRGDAYYPADEYVTVNEGETLAMHCAASRNYLQSVWWGKLLTSTNTDWLTEGTNVHTSDTRVFVESSSIYYNWQVYDVYSIHITRVAASDQGRYICYVRWSSGTSYGNVLVSVNSFPEDDPVCSASEVDTSTVRDTTVRCDTALGNPGVNITWMIQETGEEVTGSIWDYRIDDQDRRQGVLNFRQRVHHQILVCTVTSSAFPSQNRTCSIGPMPELSSTEGPITTEIFDETTVETDRSHTVTTKSRTAETTIPPTELTGQSIDCQTFPCKDAKVTGVTMIPRDLEPPNTVISSADIGTVSVAVAVPSFVLFLILLVGILKQRKRLKRRQKQSNREPGRNAGVVIRNSAPQTLNTLIEIPRRGDSACNEISPPGGESCNLPYEMELHPAGPSASYTEASERNDVSKGFCVTYETVQRDNSDTDSVIQESGNLYEHANISGTSVSNTRCCDTEDGALDDSDKIKSEVSIYESEGMVDNVIYESYDG